MCCCAMICGLHAGCSGDPLELPVDGCKAQDGALLVQDGVGGQQGARGSAGGSISSGAPLGLDTLEGCRKRLGELATEMISLRQVVATQQSTISQLQVTPLEQLVIK